MLLGCSSTMVPFTHELRNQHSLTNDDVRHLQFLCVARSDAAARRPPQQAADRGRVAQAVSRQTNRNRWCCAKPHLVWPPKITADNITVSFAEGSALTFSLRGTSPVLEQPLRVEKRRFAQSPNPFPLDSGEPTSKSASDSLFGAYFLRSRSSGGLVSFHGAMWEVDNNSHKAHLMIASEALEEVVETHGSTGRPYRVLFPQEHPIDHVLVSGPNP